MAINRDDFIFHSEYLPHARIQKLALSVTPSGSLAAGARRLVAGPWQEIGESSILAEAVWKVPTHPNINRGGSTDVGSWSDGWVLVYMVGTQGGQQPTGIWIFPFVEVQGSKVRVATTLLSNISTTATLPSLKFDFLVSVFLIPPAV